MNGPGILADRLPALRPWEPPIVTTLRRFVRRGASANLLVRIAGGPRCWRELNLFWNLDGRGRRRVAPALDEAPTDSVLAMSPAERRIGLMQLADECAEAGVAMPILKVLAGHFGVSRHAIANDLDVLRRDGKLAWTLTSDGETGVRRILEPA